MHSKHIFSHIAYQIMPQLLNSFKDLDIDWGVLAIYTCTRSCNTTNEYVDEYCFKQDISENLQPWIFNKKNPDFRLIAMHFELSFEFFYAFLFPNILVSSMRAMRPPYCHLNAFTLSIERSSEW